MLDIHLEALKKAYREQIAWMKARAQEYETGNCQHKVIDGAFIHDRTLELAADYRHRANNLQAIIDACERLSMRQSKLGATEMLATKSGAVNQPRNLPTSKIEIADGG